MILFATDYDGTIRFEEGIKEKDLAALRELKRQGNLIAIVTGRSLASLVVEIDMYNIPCDYLVGNNGGIILNDKLEIIKRYEINFKEALEIIDHLKDKDLINIYVDDGITSGQHQDEDFVGIYASFKKVPMSEVINEGVIVGVKTKVASEQVAAKLIKEINGYNLKSAIAYQNKNMIDIVPNGVSKATAVEFLADYLKPEKIYTIGDADNDIPMIKEFNGFALANANDRVKASASKVFAGVSEAIEYILDNK